MIHIVLYEPEIPQNTGNIMRTCVATNTKLHLVGALGFILDSKKVKRSVMDYEEKLQMKRHVDWDAFKKSEKGEYYFLTRFSKQIYSDVDFSETNKDVYLIFGGESKGLPPELKKEYEDTCLRIPMDKKARSMNLSNSVALVVYEVLRQRGFEDLSLVNIALG